MSHPPTPQCQVHIPSQASQVSGVSCFPCPRLSLDLSEGLNTFPFEHVTGKQQNLLGPFLLSLSQGDWPLNQIMQCQHTSSVLSSMAWLHWEGWRCDVADWKRFRFQQGRCCQVSSHTLGSSEAAWQDWEMQGKLIAGDSCKLHTPGTWLEGSVRSRDPSRITHMLCPCTCCGYKSPISSLSICLLLCLSPHACLLLVSVFVTVYISVCL